jgi:hypothetical protein
METIVKPVQNSRGRKRRWPAEQKLAVLQEWNVLPHLIFGQHVSRC